jgi:hypothetical protein
VLVREVIGLLAMLIFVMLSTAGGTGAAGLLMAVMMLFSGFGIKDVVG